MRKQESRKIKEILIFFYLYLVENVKKWRDEKLNYLVKKKREGIENIVYIKLLSCLIT